MLSMLTGLIGLLVGSLIGHWLSIGRDKRAEFNRVSEPVFGELESQRLLAKRGIFPNQGNITEQNLIQFKQHLSNRKRERFNRDYDKYLTAREESMSQKDFEQNFHSPELLISAIEKLQGKNRCQRAIVSNILISNNQFK